jgi:methionyl-tRNA formyltransferase
MSAARIVFAGTPDFALESLRRLVESGNAPDAVLTQPDRPAGRGKQLTASPVKEYALRQDIPVLQPVTLRDPDAVAEIAALDADLLIVAAYGLLLPQAVLDLPRSGCLNVHASLLPRWRGAAPIQHAILAGDAETGVCLMHMEAGLDTGPVYVSESTSIGDEETAGELHDRLARLGADLLVDKLEAILRGDLEAKQQDEIGANYASKIRRQDAALDWTRPAAEIARAVRAYNPVPGAWFELDGESIKCWQARVLDDGESPPGVVLDAGKDGVDVACGEGVLRLLEVQRPGRRRVTAAEFAAQNSLVGKRLG